MNDKLIRDMLGMTSTTTTLNSPSLTYEAMREMIDATLPVVYYAASECFPDDGSVIVYDKEDAKRHHSPFLETMQQMYGDLSYLIFCHPSSVPVLKAKLRNVARLEPITKIQEHNE